jgi:hypothetical protein
MFFVWVHQMESDDFPSSHLELADIRQCWFDLIHEEIAQDNQDATSLASEIDVRQVGV